GNFEKVSGHLRYPGTIGVRQETFQMLLEDVARSLKLTGFENIILIGDSGGNTEGMLAVREKLSAEWGGETGIYHIPEFFDNPRWNEWLVEKGIKEVSEGIHDSYRYSAMMMLADPEYVRAKVRIDNNLFSINGIDLAPIEQTLSMANELADHQVAVTVEAINKLIENK
ncbi:MAG: creatininase family protein, partial [Cyclobacteriaceae bacterium]|nr:creatininase family protein [Cyclobacteriaceae bacterium HetDA_MAG_MS6]